MWKTWTTTNSFWDLPFDFYAVFQIQIRAGSDKDRPTKWLRSIERFVDKIWMRFITDDVRGVAVNRRLIASTSALAVVTKLSRALLLFVYIFLNIILWDVPKSFVRALLWINYSLHSIRKIYNLCLLLNTKQKITLCQFLLRLSCDW